MNLIQTVLAFVLALGPLVIFHELGHYLVARLCGVKVLRFSIGMGRVVGSRRFGPDQTEWAVSALPLGGYVKMLDARDPATGAIDPKDRAREFTGQNVWKPAVRGVTEPNSPSHSFSTVPWVPSVPGLPHSKTTTAAKPTTSSAAVVASVSRVWRVRWRHGRRWRRRWNRSTSTGKPRPPTMMLAMMAPVTSGSKANRLSESA